MGMSLHRITCSIRMYTFRGYTSLIADEDKGEYPGKTRFRKYRFRGIIPTCKYNNTSTLLPLLAENCSRATQLYRSSSCSYINGWCRASSIPFQTKSDEFTLAQLTGAFRAASFPPLLYWIHSLSQTIPLIIIHAQSTSWSRTFNSRVHFM